MGICKAQDLEKYSTDVKEKGITPIIIIIDEQKLHTWDSRYARLFFFCDNYYGSYALFFHTSALLFQILRPTHPYPIP